ncbi:MAG: Thiol disulfide oxidoreductase [Myxococcaceae bacterium]|nr:Thiol disulfide oxidoreductase [Myxococcaceae bacterium]
MPLRPHLAALAVCLAGCLPEREPPRGLDSGPPISFDVPPVDTPPVDRPTPDVPPLDRPAPVDAGADVVEAGTDRPAATGDGPDPNRPYPSGPYGTTVGTVIRPFELATCDSTAFRFNGPDWVPARATVLEITAGYCTGCAMLARSIQEQVYAPYRALGLRVVGVLIDGASPGDPASPAFCRQWNMQSGITHPMALDLGNTLLAYTTGRPLPQWILTDHNGRIVWRDGGTAAHLTELRAELDALLGGP